jgi:hypothetical protein
MGPLKEQFDFNCYFYEIALEEIETNFWERLFTKKSTKNIFYIRRKKKHYAIKDSPEEVLYYDYPSGSLGYRFFAVTGETINPCWTIEYYETSTEAEKLLINLMSKHNPSKDNVVFSTGDL